MKKLKTIFIALVGVLALGCTNQKVVDYNTERLNIIENYLENHKMIKDSDKLREMEKNGEIEYDVEYKSLEREAKEWQESQAK